MRVDFVTVADDFGLPAGGAGDKMRTAPELFFNFKVIVVADAKARTDLEVTRAADTEAL